ncbi:MAG: tetratricopeptide repeat protein [Thermoplasmata archaeon]|nr:tetratricopeptide repeat protein [Thermoplasmata archaeon]
MPGPRRLAAIMFTDIVGFTALAQANESEAMRLLERHHEILRPFFARFRGREVKTIGDSFLVEFESALEATTCAIEIQRSLRSDPATSEPDRLQLRIGVHLGDVIESDGDVLGDAVNIASRIEPLSVPGGVCISAQVFDQVQNKLDVAFEALVGPELKNVRVPITVYRVVFPAASARVAADPATPEPVPRLAVLPFANMSPNANDDYFADGLTDEIITELSHIPNLRVIARTSVMRYKSAAKGVREIGAELRVGNVLEGSVRKSGNRIRITVQLIDAASEEHLWAERFDRELEDIFAIQSDIAENVAQALDLRLRAPVSTRRRTHPNVEAYTLYLRGRSLWNRRTVPDVREAMRRFQEAVEVDPEFSLAHSGVADCYSILLDRSALAEVEAVPKGRAAALRALELDPRLAEAHASLGAVLAQAGEFRESERELRAAIELNPGYSTGHHWLCLTLLCLGRVEEAALEIARAEESDPLSPAVLNSSGLSAWAAGRPDEALRKWDRALEISPSHDAVTFNRVSLLALTGHGALASEVLRSYGAGPADAGSKLWVTANGHAVLGERAETERSIERLNSLPPGEQLPTKWFAMTYALLGDLDRAYGILFDGAGRVPFSVRASMWATPALAKFRADPRFQELVTRWESEDRHAGSTLPPDAGHHP